MDDDGYIEFDEGDAPKRACFPYEVDLRGEKLKLDKLAFLESGRIEGIRFTFGGQYLFIFASSHNLVLTASKYDLFGEVQTDFPKREAVLKIRKIKGA